MSKTQTRKRPNVKINNSLAGSMWWSVGFHALVMVSLLTTMSFSTTTPPIMVSLHTDPGKDVKPIKAGLVDRRPYELAQQQRLQAEKLLKQEIFEQEQAQKALELAKIQKENAVQAAKLAAETAVKVAAQKKVQQKQLELKQAAEIKMTEKKSAEKKAAALKAEQDRLQAQHNDVLMQEVDKFKAVFRAAIEENRIISAVFAQNIQCKVRIRLLPDGSILSLSVVETSGNVAYDQMQINAIYKTAPFAMPSDHELYNELRDIVLSLKNGEQADV